VSPNRQNCGLEAATALSITISRVTSINDFNVARKPGPFGISVLGQQVRCLGQRVWGYQHLTHPGDHFIHAVVILCRESSEIALLGYQTGVGATDPKQYEHENAGFRRSPMCLTRRKLLRDD